ncbi:BTB/POZ and MATH domain-containing protein 2 [Ananas comosus]|uniref:BTB/POZ and MATH domain-containing protein 2 n=2 Tax=Ananas comosus TaxID=4615 RepID=A0A199W1N2_ANACO|nr:BTB/POZ and MATH domain-containing protein 2 [Ananas comosus]
MAASASASETSSTWVTETASGSHRFTVTGYSLTKGIGVGKPISSGIFTVGAHDWSVKFFPDGYTQDAADCVSLFLALESDAADVRAVFNLTLLDHAGKPSTSTPTDRQPKSFKRGVERGFSRFIERSRLESNFLKDDCLVVHCTVTVLKESRLQVPNSCSTKPRPSDLHLHLERLLESGEGTDVTFRVGGEAFSAHRWLLAARSPVFKAELFGEMKEKNLQSIEIKDMEAVVFKTLLHFVYSDALPRSEELACNGSSTVMLQHLLAAADRYGLERLKLICEDELCADIHISTAATTLVLAEQHRCGQLKTACLEFMACPDVLSAVVQTDGFEHLRISCPSALKELLEKLSKMIVIANVK